MTIMEKEDFFIGFIDDFLLIFVYMFGFKDRNRERNRKIKSNPLQNFHYRTDILHIMHLDTSETKS